MSAAEMSRSIARAMEDSGCPETARYYRLMARELDAGADPDAPAPAGLKEALATDLAAWRERALAAERERAALLAACKAAFPWVALAKPSRMAHPEAIANHAADQARLKAAIARAEGGAQ